VPRRAQEERDPARDESPDLGDEEARHESSRPDGCGKAAGHRPLELARARRLLLHEVADPAADLAQAAIAVGAGRLPPSGVHVPQDRACFGSLRHHGVVLGLRDAPHVALQRREPLVALVGRLCDLVRGHRRGLVVQHLLPSRRGERRAVILEGSAAESVAVRLWALERRAAWIEEWRHRRDEELEACVASAPLEELPAVVHTFDRIAVRLSGDPDHEEEIDAVHAPLQRVGERAFEGIVVAAELAEAAAQVRPVRLERELETVPRQPTRGVEEPAARRGEQLEHQLVLHGTLAQELEEAFGVLGASHADVVQQHDRPPTELRHRADVAHEGVGRPEGGAVAPGNPLGGRVAAAADGAIERTAPRCEEARHRVARPAGVGHHVGETTVPEHGADDVLVVGECRVGEARGDGGRRIDHDPAGLVLPGEARHACQRSPGAQRSHERRHRFLGRVPAQHQVYLGAGDQLAVEVGRAQPAHDDGRLRMMALDDAGDLDGAVRVHQPVEIDAEDDGVESRDDLLDVVAGAAEHPIGQVDDPDVVAVALEPSADAREPDGIHLEDLGRRHDVADRPEERAMPSEVVQRWWVQEDQIRREESAGGARVVRGPAVAVPTVEWWSSVASHAPPSRIPD